MNKIILLSLLFTYTDCLSLTTSIPALVSHEEVVKKVFHEKKGITKLSHQSSIIKTFTAFHTAQLKDLIPALEQVVTLLSLQEKKYTDTKPQELRAKIALTIITIQKEHIAKYCKTLHNRLSRFEKVLLWIYEKNYSLITPVAHIIKKSYKSPIEKLAHQLEWYTFFEREHALTDYNSALHFFAQHRKTTYPPCFTFWKEDSDKVKVLVLLQQLDTTITTQGELAAEMLGTAAEDTAETILGGTMEEGAENVALSTVKAESSLLTEAFGDASFDFSSDAVIDTQVSAVESVAPELESTMADADKALEQAATDDATLLDDAGSAGRETPRKGSDYYKQKKASFAEQQKSLDEELSATQQQMSDLNNQLEKVNNVLDKKTAQLSAARSKLKSLKNSPSYKASILKDANFVDKDVEAAEARVTSLSQQCKALQSKSDALQKSFTKVAQKNSQIIIKQASLKQALENLLAEEAAEKAAEAAAQDSTDTTDGTSHTENGEGDALDAENSIEGDILEDGEDGDGEEYVPKKTGAERLQELKEQHNAKMAQLKETYQDKSKGFFTRAKAYLSFGFKKVATPLRWLDDRLDAYVSSKASNSLHKNFGNELNALENNPIRQAIQQLPPSWQGIAEMMIQMEVMQGTSIVAFWYEQDNEEVYEEWQKKQYAMSQLNSKFTSLMTVQQKQNLNLTNQTFINNRKLLSANKAQEQTIAAFSQQWIEQAIFSSPPSSFFTAQASNIGNNNLPAIDDDYKFQLSSMITPETTQTGRFTPTVPNAWRNLYRTGNWQFISSNNTFCQLALVPVTSGAVTTQANQVLGNSIFRDYIPAQQLSYNISTTCTLYTYQFPFFIGLLFNKGRWISGIPDKAQQCRFVGLFGTADKKIYFVYEESKISSPQEIAQGAPSTQSPFYRILKNPTLYTLPKNLFSPGSLPCAFTITTTSYDLVNPTLANTVTATLVSSNTPAHSCSITNTTCSTDNGLQHGIGFVSAGCIGSFTIKAPQDLVYTQQDLALINKNLATIISNIQGGS